MAKVLFYTATAAKFATLEAKNENALYFITDTGELYKGAVRYTFPVQQVTEFPESGDSGVLYVTELNMDWLLVLIPLRVLLEMLWNIPHPQVVLHIL